ncbi:MAG: membrane protein insertase YidC [Candidatus Latescibacterota bacterium]
MLAFVAIGVVLLLMPYYYEWAGLAPKAPAPEARTEAPATSPEDEQGRLADGASGGDSGAESGSRGAVASEIPPLEVGQAHDIVVTTPLQRMTFSTEGGVMTSCRLMAYRRGDGSEVDLVALGGRGLTLAIRRINEVQDLGEVVFGVDREGLELEAGQSGTIRFVAQVAEGVLVEKVLSFSADQYGFGMEVAYRGLDPDAEIAVRWERGLAFTEATGAPDLAESRALAFFNDELSSVQVEDSDEEETWGPYKGELRWVGVRSKYFLSALIPRTAGIHRVTLHGRGGTQDRAADYSYEIGLRAEAAGQWQGTVYLGPLEYDNLVRQGVELEQAIDFGWPVVKQVSKLLLVIFKAAYEYVPNYGWIIVLFAVAIKILVSPLTHKTNESTAKMQELQPKIAALKEKYKNDSQRLSRETMKLYKEEGVNPLGGCLPLLLQMPVFFALYNLFGRTIELRQAPFALWITDLSVPDELRLAGFGVHVLPFLMGASMWLQQKMTMKDPKQAMLVYLMPVVMIFIFWQMTSGLVLYWTVFNVLTIGQQVVVNLIKGKPAFA